MDPPCPAFQMADLVNPNPVVWIGGDVYIFNSTPNAQYKWPWNRLIPNMCSTCIRVVLELD